jgi:hypothetical protein
VFLCTNKAVEAALAPQLGAGVRTGHFGAVRGLNDHEDDQVGLMLGRHQTTAKPMEGYARAFWATSPEPLLLTGEYVKATRHIRKRDGTIVPVQIDVHPDPRVQRVVELFRERESEQAIDRLRLIFNKERKAVYVASNVPLPDLVVDRTVTHNELVREITGRTDNGRAGAGRRLYASLADLMLAAGGVVFGNPADAARAYPTLWPNRAGTGGSPEAAKKAFQRARLGTLPKKRHIAECPQPLRRATYQRAGTGWVTSVNVVEIWGVAEAATAQAALGGSCRFSLPGVGFSNSAKASTPM